MIDCFDNPSWFIDTNNPRLFSVLGYEIPKGTIVIANLASVHFDSITYKDPLKFNPSRHMDGKEFNKPKEFLPYSIGENKVQVYTSYNVLYLIYLLYNMLYVILICEPDCRVSYIWSCLSILLQLDHLKWPMHIVCMYYVVCVWV